MKRYPSLLIVLSSLALVSCQQSPKAMKPFDKSSLLQLVKKVVQAEHRTPGQGLRIFNSYSADHHLVILDSAKENMDPTAVQVRVSRSKEFAYYELILPPGLRHQLAYPDFDSAYGSGIESPRPKEPSSYTVMYYIANGGDIAIIVSSELPPTIAHPNIDRIMVML